MVFQNVGPRKNIGRTLVGHALAVGPGSSPIPAALSARVVALLGALRALGCGVGAYAPVSGIASAIRALFATLVSYTPVGNNGGTDPREGRGRPNQLDSR
jgi:hypothetical protein